MIPLRLRIQKVEVDNFGPDAVPPEELEKMDGNTLLVDPDGNRVGAAELREERELERSRARIQNVKAGDVQDAKP